MPLVEREQQKRVSLTHLLCFACAGILVPAPLVRCAVPSPALSTLQPVQAPDPPTPAVSQVTALPADNGATPRPPSACTPLATAPAAAAVPITTRHARSRNRATAPSAATSPHAPGQAAAPLQFTPLVPGRPDLRACFAVAVRLWPPLPPTPGAPASAIALAPAPATCCALAGAGTPQPPLWTWSSPLLPLPAVPSPCALAASSSCAGRVPLVGIPATPKGGLGLPLQLPFGLASEPRALSDCTALPLIIRHPPQPPSLTSTTSVSGVTAGTLSNALNPAVFGRLSHTAVNAFFPAVLREPSYASTSAVAPAGRSQMVCIPSCHGAKPCGDSADRAYVAVVCTPSASLLPFAGCCAGMP